MIESTWEDGLAIITIDRQQSHNALDPASMVDLRDALVAADAADDVRVIIITGAGDRAFCAGADIRATSPAKRSFISTYFDRDTPKDHPLYVRNIAFSRLELRKPVIGAINGVAAGGGMEIALNCDICIASENARFGLTEVRIGSIPAVGGIQRLVRSLPRPVAMRMLLSGEIVDAHFALQWGLIAELVPAEQLMLRARELGQRIAANAPLAVKSAKLLAEKAAELPFSEAVVFEEMLWGHLYATDDRIEGRKAFTEKRKPEFHGE
jgi:E-phenylitaconyl-CoA hydratase